MIIPSTKGPEGSMRNTQIVSSNGVHSDSSKTLVVLFTFLSDKFFEYLIMYLI